MEAGKVGKIINQGGTANTSNYPSLQRLLLVCNPGRISIQPAPQLHSTANVPGGLLTHLFSPFFLLLLFELLAKLTDRISRKI